MSKETWKDKCCDGDLCNGCPLYIVCGKSLEETKQYIVGVLKDLAKAVEEDVEHDSDFFDMIKELVTVIDNRRGYLLKAEVTSEVKPYTSIESISDAVWCDRCGQELGDKRYIRNDYAFCSAACAEKHLQDFGR